MRLLSKSKLGKRNMPEEKLRGKSVNHFVTLYIKFQSFNCNVYGLKIVKAATVSVFS